MMTEGGMSFDICDDVFEVSIKASIVQQLSN